MYPIGKSLNLDSQTAYWDTAGTTKQFTHPLHAEWLEHTGRDSRVLDYGCGYGRTLAILRDAGWTSLTGVDISPALVERARTQVPTAEIHVLDDPPRVAYPENSFDIVLLVAVLTCVPSNQGQQHLAAELGRVLRPGGLLYLSDVLLQTDARNLARYEQFAREQDMPYGTFLTDDGAVCRHHDRQRLHGLFPALETVEERDTESSTMNGNVVTTTQMMLRNPLGS